jgi:glycosyltransferase involved in cell wall biosynthesis
VRILHVSHGHPAFIAGGAEIASFELFHRMVQLEYDAYYMARVGPPMHLRRPGTPFQSVPGETKREILFYSDHFDGFLFSQREETAITLHFREFLESLRPDVVHFTHTLYMGVEMIRQVRNVLPRATIVYTFHEFLPICAADGRMIRIQDRSLCDHATPLRCHECFPERTPQDFFLRELFIKSHLENVDAFISPSRFLLDRYISWGLPKDKFHLIENGRSLQKEAPARTAAPGEGRGQFGYFGQLNPDKGLQVLLAAMRILTERGHRDIHLRIHGANLDKQSPQFQASLKELLEQTSDNVTMLPEYKQADLPSLMQEVDWVVVPSTWWENAPLTIQEAFMHRRPVICSNIGGMAEKVRDEVDGLHFRVKDAHSVADTLLRAAHTEGLWERLRESIRPVFAVDASVEAHVALYRSLPERVLA